MAKTLINLHRDTKLLKLTIDNYRHIQHLEIPFDQYNVVGIFGTNGTCKTSILRIIQCLFQQDRVADLSCSNAKFNFSVKRFVSEQYRFVATLGHKVDSSGENFDIPYYYSEKESRWLPRHTRKPYRNVYYVGLSLVVPENEISKNRGTQKKQEQIYTTITNHQAEICTALNSILGNQFENFSTKQVGNTSHLILMKNGEPLSAADLSAGEQRLLKLLDYLYNASEYSLLLIDEIESTLHHSALKALMDIIVGQANSRHLQVIFTSHRHELFQREDIGIVSLFISNHQVCCAEGKIPACVEQLTGNFEKDYVIFVEDTLSEQIIKRLLYQRKKQTLVEVVQMGSYTKLFMAATTLYSMNKLSDNMLFILDGDVCKTEDEKKHQVDVYKTYGAAWPDDVKNEIISHFVEYKLSKPHPEEMIINILKSSTKDDQYIEQAKNIGSYTIPPDYVARMNEKAIKDRVHYDEKHYYIKELARLVDEQEISIAENNIVRLCSEETEQWNSLVENVVSWLDSKGL